MCVCVLQLTWLHVEDVKVLLFTLYAMPMRVQDRTQMERVIRYLRHRRIERTDW